MDKRVKEYFLEMIKNNICTSFDYDFIGMIKRGCIAIK